MAHRHVAQGASSWRDLWATGVVLDPSAAAGAAALWVGKLWRGRSTWNRRHRREDELLKPGKLDLKQVP